MPKRPYAPRSRFPKSGPRKYARHARTRPSRIRPRVRGGARPMRSLRMSSNGPPNQYRFVRETSASTLDFVSGLGARTKNVVLNFDNFKVSLLSGFATDFGPLFTNYKVDKIEHFIQPMWSVDQMVAFPPKTADIGDNTGSPIVGAMVITKINNRWVDIATGLSGMTDADLMSALAQIQMKTRLLYSRKKPIVITTHNPQIFQTASVDVAGGVTEVVQRRSPWLSIANSADVELASNTVLTGELCGGEDFPTGIFMARVWTRCHFRCSLVN